MTGVTRRRLDQRMLHSGSQTPGETMSDLGWWTISGEALLDLLRRAHAGEDPDLLYAEEYANAEIETHE